MITGKYSIVNREFDVVIKTGIPELDIRLNDNKLLTRIFIDISSRKSRDFSKYNYMSIVSISENKNITFPNIFSIAFTSNTKESPTGTYFIPILFDTKSDFPKINDNPNFLLDTLLTKIMNDEFKKEISTIINNQIAIKFDSDGVGGLDRSVGINLMNRNLISQALNETQQAKAYEETGNEAFLPIAVKDIFIF